MQEYDMFVEKFTRKKTTDDCYTPPEVYEYVKKWAVEHYGIDENKIVRPFYPDTDYRTFEYPEGAVVLDNPPFSILDKILRFYKANGTKCFLFCLAQTALGKVRYGYCLVSGANIVYENGAELNTAFLTNLSDNVIECDPDFCMGLKQVVRRTKQRIDTGKGRCAKTLTNSSVYEYPHEVITGRWALLLQRRPAPVALSRNDVTIVTKLDHMEKKGKKLFGQVALLLNEHATIQKDCAEKYRAMTVDRIELSEREIAIIEEMNKAIRTSKQGD